jgi:hypothetical protein
MAFEDSGSSGVEFCATTHRFLRRPRPVDKSLCNPLAGAPAAEKLGKRSGSKTIRWDRREQGEHRLALPDTGTVKRWRAVG